MPWTRPDARGTAFAPSSGPPPSTRPSPSLPLTLLTLGETATAPPKAILIAIAGRTYRVERLAATPLAPALWRLTRLPLSDDGPYYVARLRDGSRRCDCAELDLSGR